VSDFLERIAKLSPKRLALLASELNSKLEELNQRTAEPIAVIGMGCRFPGEADDPNSFWRLMIEGRDAIDVVPSERWDIDALYDPDPDAPGKMSTRWGGFLERIELFDPEFFGISPREAAGMDPQQRLLLEVVWEALENAGQNPDRLAGSQTSVFVGVCNSDYFLMRFESARAAVDAYVATGNAHSVASGRISYILGLKGPSVSVDTACSSSLTAVHLACQSLKAGECRMAIAGGVNLILMPDTTMILSKSHMMAPDGRCKPFDAAADGFVRSEGCGIVLLKRLSEAQADGDNILALIRGTASNQDGHSSGLTAPNGPSQVAVIRKALANAGLQPGDIDFIEAHGTGTALGDPIEARALAEIFGPGRTSEHSLRVGSVKGNLGHAESAAGIAGLIKAILALQHGKIPATLHLQSLSPHVDWNGLAITVPTVTTSWTRETGPRFAGISSFGFSGTNAHVILSDSPAVAQLPNASDPLTRKLNATPLLLVLSARTGPALVGLARKYEQFLREKQELDLADICYSASTGRAHFEHRLAVVAEDLPEARERLGQFQRGDKHRRIQSRRAISSASTGVVFMFTGQGSQYVGMGRELFETQSVFRRELERCAEILRPLLDRPILELLFGEKDEDQSLPLLDETQYSQPALFALEYALATMWRSWGVEPAAVLGHSVGEYVAACLAGIFSLEDGLRLIAERGRLMGTLPRGGAMAAVFAEESRVSEAIFGTATAIACLNGPANTVISGEGVALSAVLERLATEGIRSHRLVVSHAFHSSLMDPILDPFQRAAEDIRYGEPRIAIVSNLTGRTAEPGLMSCSEYWRGHIRNPVRFADSIRSLRESGQSVFLEIGPHPVLTGLARLSMPETEGVWAVSLRRETRNWESLVESVSTLYLHGVNVEWTGLYAMHKRKRVVLPTYPFQRGRYWLEPRKPGQPTMALRSVEEDLGSHPLLGKRLDSPALSEAVFELEIGQERPAFLNDHRIFGRLLMPSPAYIEMALAGAASIFQLLKRESLPCEVADLIIREPLFLPEEESCLIQIIFEKPSKSRMGFRICSRDKAKTSDNPAADPWRTHVTGSVRVGIEFEQLDIKIWNRQEVWERCSEEMDARSYYDSLTQLGLDFGDRFQGIVGIRRCDGEALAEIRLPASLANDTRPYRIHPALLDSCFHLLGAALPPDNSQNAYLLIGLERFTLFALAAETLWNHTVLRSSSGADVFTGDIWLYAEDGRMVAEILGLHLKRATGAAMTRAGEAKSDNWFYDVAWREQETSVATEWDEGSALTADFIPAPGLLAERARGQLRELALSERLSIYGELIPRLEVLSAGLIKRAVFRMGWSPQPGERFTTAELGQRLKVTPTHRRLFERLIGILAEEKLLKPEDGGWTVLNRLETQTSDLESEAEGLQQLFPECSAEVALTARCGGRLDEVLRGTCDPLQLLFPGGDFDIANALYRTSPYARALNTAVRHVVVRAIENAPNDRMVRILEIGAGTGGTTSFLLPHLPPERTRYTFTDVSALFLARARDEFRDFPFATFELLDIEKPPAVQGFAERSFDVVIAANVLHATRDLRETLQQVVSLLAPGGLLILLEGTNRLRWVDLTFGLTEGWWRFDDTALRSDYALISVQQWEALLKESGLEAEHSAVSLGKTDFVAQGILIGQKPLVTDESLGTEVTSGFWIVLGDTEGIAEEVAILISKGGDRCMLVSQTSEDKPSDKWRVALDPRHVEDFAGLFSDALTRHEGPLKGVLNLWPVDEEIRAETTPSEWEAAQARLGGGVLHTTQSFLSLPSSSIWRGARIWLATRGAQVVSSERNSSAPSSQPAQALVWGLARVISLEHPERFGCVIDLDHGTSAKESAAAIWSEIRTGAREDAVAYRGGRRLLPRVVRTVEPPSDALTLREDGSYLITGGLGGLGLQIAGWMAEQGAGHIVLLSRRDFPERCRWEQLNFENANYDTVRKILDTEKLGARITVAQGDVADEIEMQSLFQRFGKEEPPLRGVVHAAVEMTSRSIKDLDLESFQRMCHAKVLGGWLLHQLTLHLELDFFVLFSSTTALWGVAGLGHYAAANQALDLLAQWRHERGLRALSVNWGTWQEMRVAGEAEKDEFVRAGLHPMPVAQALAALERLVSADRTSAIVASIDWNRLRAVYEARRARPLFAEMRSRAQTENGVSIFRKSAVPDPEVYLRLQTASPARRRDILIAHLCSQANSILGFGLSRGIELEQGLFEMGMDSLMAVELRGRLERSLGLPLPSTLTFNYPTINALAGYLLSEALQFDSASTPEQSPPIEPTALAKAVSVEQPSDELSEDEISVLLLKKLEQI
jgi:acyl transferase domain-containing protein/ubiquinone/menaquinone biosynthesis C-methylase UbiE/acyl carrier protein